jgi:site-specific recombinase XerD
MIEDMHVRHFAANTQETYIRAVEKLAGFLDRSPATATLEDLRRFQLHLTGTHVLPATINVTVSALRFFFTVTFDRPDVARRLTLVHQPYKPPVVLSQEEVSRHETIDGDHGRIETRRYTVFHDVEWLRKLHDWPGLKGLVMVESTREINGKITQETRLYIASPALLANLVGPMIRDHWAVENV